MATASANLASKYLVTAEWDRAARADAERFDSLYQEHLGRIYRYVYSWVRNREEAEDLTAEIFLKAVRGVDYERSSKEIERWLFQVARTIIADYLRTRYRIPTCSFEELLNTEGEDAVQEELTVMNCKHANRVQYYLPHLSTNSPEELLDTNWEAPVVEELTTANYRSADHVERLLQALPKHYGEVLTCRFLLNLSIRDTALKMGVTLSNVKVLQFRALKRAAELEYIVTD
jgi:RNA polymerase sigma-70 factor, ECF subfamily